MDIRDRSVLEAASWRLASELARRHPGRVRLIRGHPGGGQSDLLWLLDRNDGPGDVRLNRNGTIQVCCRFDGLKNHSWKPTEWVDYLADDPRKFLERLELASGLKAPAKPPSATPTTLTYRVLACIAALSFKTVHPIVIEQGFIDSSGYGVGRNALLERFSIDPELLRPRADEIGRDPGCRIWMPVRNGEPILAIEDSSATAWLPGSSKPVDLMETYRDTGRDVSLTACVLLSRALKAA